MEEVNHFLYNIINPGMEQPKRVNLNIKLTTMTVNSLKLKIVFFRIRPFEKVVFVNQPKLVCTSLKLANFAPNRIFERISVTKVFHHHKLG